MLRYISERFCKNVPDRFLPGFGVNDPKPCGGGASSRLGRVHGPANGLSAGGLLAGSCQKQGGGEGVLY